jgi:hypothetical protein
MESALTLWLVGVLSISVLIMVPVLVMGFRVPRPGYQPVERKDSPQPPPPRGGSAVIDTRERDYRDLRRDYDALAVRVRTLEDVLADTRRAR